jgi:cytochrome bd-type quinol oxidase subunit 2
MDPDFAHLAATWRDFYLLAGTAAATLLGLMFVAVTFGASFVSAETSAEASETARAFLDPTFMHFVQVLLTACALVSPSMGPTLLGALLVVGGIARISSLGYVYRQMRAAHGRHNDLELEDWLSGIVVPLAAHLVLIGTGAGFLMGRAAFAWLAVVTIVVLVTGVYSAWELLLWLALTRARSGNRDHR